MQIYIILKWIKNTKRHFRIYFNKEPMTYYVYRGDKAVSIDTFRYTFVDDIGINWYLVKKNFQSAVVDLIKYWYLDYDGDGMPELIMDMGRKNIIHMYINIIQIKNVYPYIMLEIAIIGIFLIRKRYIVNVEKI